jgi:ubiquitin-conjugating enzyme E2 O
MQDGTYEEGLLSVDLYPIHHLDDHEFFPGDFVALAESQDFQKYGVIQKTDHSGNYIHQSINDLFRIC